MELYLPMILDGATGTELQKVGYKGDVCAEQWVLENPDAIRDLHTRYIDAGSNIVYTPTFGGNRVKLEENGIFNRTQEFNEKLATIAIENAAGKALVAGDISPTGLFAAPLGNITFDELNEAYREQVEGLEKAGVDLYVIETMMTLSDARAAILAVKEISDKPVMVSFTCNENGKTLAGGDVEAALVVMQSMGADIFGLNCSMGPEDMVAPIERLHRYAEVPLAAKPNAGKPEFIDGKAVYNCTPEEYIGCVEDYAKNGVQMFGGCCGTDERYIKAIKEILPSLEMVPPSPVKGRLICATERTVFELDPNEKCGRILAVHEDIADDIEEENESGSGFISVRLESMADAETLTDNMYMLEKPLCLVTDNERVLERMLRNYNGTALYEGGIDRKVLEKLSKTYGMIY